MTDFQAIQILRDVAKRGNEWKLSYGNELRNKMYSQLDQKQEPEGYRYNWLMASAKELIGRLSNIAFDFNSDHPSDRASIEDMLDILDTAKILMNNKNAKS